MTFDEFIEKYQGKFVEDKNCYSLIIKSPKYGEKNTLIDKDSINLLLNYNLYVHKIGKYFYIRLNPIKVHLHSFISKPETGLQVDHINRDTLDNRKINLRNVTQQDNLRNQKRENNKTGRTGVAIGHKGKYTAQIKTNYKKIHLGTFDTIEEAYIARKNAERIYWI